MAKVNKKIVQGKIFGDNYFPQICFVCFYPATKFAGSRDFSPTPKLFQQPSVADRKVRTIYVSGPEASRSRNLVSTAGLAGVNTALLPLSPQGTSTGLKICSFWL